MAATKDPGYKKYLAYLKDFVYIVGLVVALGGWITSKTRSQAILETTVQNNTKTIEKFEKFIEKQTELNEDIIYFMGQHGNN